MISPAKMLSGIKGKFSELVGFVKAVAGDSRIPERDRKILLVLVGLILSPIDLIPDWIPFFGQIDDVVILALILDYFFEVLDREILLAHYPWGLASFLRMKRMAGWASTLAPGFIKKRLWAYAGSPYRR